MHISTKKRRALGAFAVLAIGVGLAFAYFTTLGDGTGEAEVGTSTEDITISATISGKLYPSTSSPITFKVDNASKGTVFVNKVTLDEVKAYEEEAHENLIAGCKDEWFKMTTGEAPAEEAVAEDEIEGEAEGVSLTISNGPAELEFENKPVNQDACKNAFLVASFSSN